MSNEIYMKLLTEINERGLDKNSPVEVMAVHNATGQTVKQLCGVYEKEVLSKLIEEYLSLQADNAALRVRLKKSIELPELVMIDRTLVDGKFKPTQKA